MTIITVLKQKHPDYPKKMKSLPGLFFIFSNIYCFSLTHSLTTTFITYYILFHPPFCSSLLFTVKNTTDKKENKNLSNTLRLL